MAIALSEFWTRLVRAGITDAAGCKKLASAYTKASGAPPSDTRSLAKFLIKAGKLTQFQARALLADQAVEIRVGSFLIRSDASPQTLSRWVPATRIDDQQPGFLLRAAEDELAGGRSDWVDAHIHVTSPTLQSFDLENHGSELLVFSPLPNGHSLHEQLADRGSLSAAESCGIGIAVAEALQAMHGRPLVHGAVRPDRVWLDESGQAVLMRDPSGPPPDSSGDHSALWLDAIDGRESYAAPELANPAQECDPSTDIYGLGCLLFHAVTGRVPYPGNSPSEILAAHAAETPPELAQAIQLGESGDPLFRVIAFAMAKSPTARFASAEQLAGALRATLPLLPRAEPAAAPATAGKVADVAAINSEKRQAAKREKKVSTRKAESRKTTSTKEKSKPAAAAKDAAPPKPKSQPQREEKRKSRKVSDSGIAAASAARPPASPPREEPPAVPEAPAEPRVDTAPAEPAFAAAEAPAIVTDSSPAPVIVTDPEAQPATTNAPVASVAVADGDSGDGEETRPARRRKKKKTSQTPLILGGMCVVILMLIVLFLIRDPNEPIAQQRGRPPIPDVIPPVTNRTNTTPTPDRTDENTATAAQSVPGYELVSDDSLLYVPPFGSDVPAAPLDMLPPGPAVIISVRLASLEDSQIGAQLIEALSPELDNLIKLAESRSKVTRESMARCGIALHPGKEGWPEVSLAIELSEPQPSDELIEKWQVAASRTAEGHTIYAGDTAESDAFYFVAGEDKTVRAFAVGSVAQISEVAASEGGGIPLPRSAQKLWDTSSEQAELVALITPNFLFADGREMLKSTAPELIAPLKSVLQPDVAVALVTAQISGDKLFLETRLAPSGGVSEPALLRGINEAFQQWPGWADEFIVESVPDPSWRLLASRLPFMMRFMADQTRFGIADGTVIANTYLPAGAVPQVTLATLLAMNTPAGAGPTVAVNTEPTRPLSVEEMLDRKMSVSFEQESLEFAIDAIVGSFKKDLPDGSTMPAVRIIGSDLQLMGITQNQQVRDFAKSDLPLRTVLTDLVLGANPDKTATGPQDPKQALVWVVTDDAENPGQKVILVTTRQAAADKYELPSEFQTES